MAKTNAIKISKEKLLEEVKVMTIGDLAKKYGVCYQTMFKYLKACGYKEGTKKVGRPCNLIIE